MPILVPLKEKYLIRRSHKGGVYRPRTGNSHGGNKPKGRQGNGPRRRQGLGSVATL